VRGLAGPEPDRRRDLGIPGLSLVEPQARVIDPGVCGSAGYPDCEVWEERARVPRGTEPVGSFSFVSVKSPRGRVDVTRWCKHCASMEASVRTFGIETLPLGARSAIIGQDPDGCEPVSPSRRMVVSGDA
jgi:hypothetical protein